MLPDRVSNPGPLTYKSGALRGPASRLQIPTASDSTMRAMNIYFTKAVAETICVVSVTCIISTT